MSDRTHDFSTAEDDLLGAASTAQSGVGMPNGGHRWSRLAGMVGALGNEQGQALLDEVGSWASTPFWRKGTGLDGAARRAVSATPDLLVRRQDAGLVVIRAPLGYASDPLVVDVVFEAVGATAGGAYEVVTAANPSYALYLALVLSREGAGLEGVKPALAGAALRILAPGGVSYGVRPVEGKEIGAEDSAGWGENKVGGGGGSPLMAGMDPGGWDPPGEQPIPLYVGVAAHEVIGKFYATAHKGDDVELNDFPIKSILREYRLGDPNKLTPAEQLLKPDIANLSRLHLYEIKPEKEALSGLAQLASYLGAFQTAGVPMSPGPTAEPGTMGILPAPAGYFIFSCLIPGLIQYSYRRSLPEPVPEPLMVPAPAPEGGLELAKRILDWDYWEEATGLTGTALILYVIISEGTRVIPARNLIPVP